MSEMNEKPKVFIKRKNIQLMLDYCLDNRIEFISRPRGFSNDDWEVEVNVTNIKKAVLLGVFLKENKLEFAGASDTAPAAPVAPKAPKKKEPKPSTENENPLLSPPTVSDETSQLFGLDMKE